MHVGAAALGLVGAQISALLGEQTCDVYLNGVAYWKNIPREVWDYTIGGYQVIKRCGSQRHGPRIAALLLLAPALDANCQSVKAATVDWSAWCSK